ncbi:hypothetical protein BC629DRAFT_1441901 [Irpex lacteus]|nr:hypothetical protein BC629DRAFT_1441901 [Irpex lacteus]
MEHEAQNMNRQSLLDKEKEALEQLVRIRRMLNSSTPASGLLPELLSEIFIWLYVMMHVPGRAVQTISHCWGEDLPYAWIGVTHVCHFWRVAALSTPQLWRTIWVTWNAELVEEMLQRSISRSLTINIMRPPTSSLYLSQADCMALIISSLPRIERICGEIPLKLKPPTHHADGGNLKDLVLGKCAAYYDDDEYNMDIEDYLGSCHIPQLNRLELHFFTPKWGRKLLRSTLKHLTLHGDEKDHIYGSNYQGPASLTQLVNILVDLPVLETLQLQFVLSLPEIRTMELRCEDNILRLRGWTESHSINKLLDNDPPGEPHVDLLLWRSWDNLWSHEFETLAMLDIVCPTSVERLLLDGDDYSFRVAEGEWARRIAEMSRLCELSVGPIACLDIVALLEVKRTSSDAGQTSCDNLRVNNPKLDVLHLQDLTRRGGGQSFEIVRSIFEAIRSREEAGFFTQVLGV